MVIHVERDDAKCETNYFRGGNGFLRISMEKYKPHHFSIECEVIIKVSNYFMEK